MFRELTRKNKALPMEECIALLKNETRGVLSVQGEDGYPYGMPMNHWYEPEDGCVYFHCGRAGHRLDSLRRDDRVSFCVMERGERRGGDWFYMVKSVILFGRVEIISDPDIIADICTRLSHKFTGDDEFIRSQIAAHSHRALILRLVPEHICGKLVKEA